MKHALIMIIKKTTKMDEQQIQDLLRVLFNLKYDWVSDQARYKSEVISEENKQIVETAIRAFMLDNRDAKIGTLEAKIFAYEQIISKSSFAPMLEDDSTHQESNSSSYK